jgi:hypothetical protein
LPKGRIDPVKFAQQGLPFGHRSIAAFASRCSVDAQELHLGAATRYPDDGAPVGRQAA